jgi:hypothetical protein
MENRRVRRLLATLVLIAAVAVGVLAITQAPAAHAGPLCEARGQAHIDRHGGLAKDSADHIARGELPTCDPNPPKDTAKPNYSDHDDEKSRYCKRKWFC